MPTTVAPVCEGVNEFDFLEKLANFGRVDNIVPAPERSFIRQISSSLFWTIFENQFIHAFCGRACITRACLRTGAGVTVLRLDECQQIRIHLVLVGRAHAVRSALVNF